MAMKAAKSPLDKVLGRLDDLDQVNLGILVQRLARERKLLETVFDVIRDGILVLDEEGIKWKIQMIRLLTVVYWTLFSICKILI